MQSFVNFCILALGSGLVSVRVRVRVSVSFTEIDIVNPYQHCITCTGTGIASRILHVSPTFNEHNNKRTFTETQYTIITTGHKKSSFVVRVVKPWNSLPEEVVT